MGLGKALDGLDPISGVRHGKRRPAQRKGKRKSDGLINDWLAFRNRMKKRRLNRIKHRGESATLTGKITAEKTKQAEGGGRVKSGLNGAATRKAASKGTTGPTRHAAGKGGRATQKPRATQGDKLHVSSCGRPNSPEYVAQGGPPNCNHQTVGGVPCWEHERGTGARVRKPGFGPAA